MIVVLSTIGWSLMGELVHNDSLLCMVDKAEDDAAYRR